MYVKISSPHGRNQIKEKPSHHIFCCLYDSFSLILKKKYFFCRHYLYEQKIARLSWKLEYKDLMFVDNVEEIISPAKRKVSFSLLMKRKTSHLYINYSAEGFVHAISQDISPQNLTRPCQKTTVYQG